MPTVAIVPYCEVDGIRTFKDSEIKTFYDRMVRDGVAPIVFHAGDVRSPSEFLQKMKSPGVSLYIVFLNNGTIAGIIWLTHFEGKSCRVHFTSFSEVWNEDTALIGREAIRQVLHMPDSSDVGYLFDVLIGLIPSRNVRAIKWLKKVGLQVSGEIPNSLWDAEEKKSISGTLLYLTR